MADLRLEDIGYILVALVLVAAARIVFAYWSEIGLLLVAFGRRYLSIGDWRAAMDRLADRGDGVKTHPRTAPVVMSRDDAWDDDDQDVADDAQQDNNAATTDCNDEFDSNALLFRGMAIALAKMVKAGTVGETKGLHDVFDVKPSSTSPRYQAAREALKQELTRLDPPARPTPIAGRVTRATFAGEDDE